MDQAKIKREIEASYAKVCTLRDEVRVKVHLAGMDAKVTLDELERRAEKAYHEVSEAAARELSDVAQKLDHLAGTIRRGGRS